MVNREVSKLKEEFCKCARSKGVTSDVDDFGYWLICVACGKKIEDSYEYHNHYDGEDHYYDD